jgi:hypothetical protein
MQFPVPQFTDVEDKIIGPLTVKQFGIIFGAGVVVFLGYSASGKNIVVLIVLALFFGLPAMGLAFVKYNGRPIYNSFGQVFKFITSEKSLFFRKEIYGVGQGHKLVDAEITTVSQVVAENTPKDPKNRLKEVQALLEKQSREEKELVGKIR